MSDSPEVPEKQEEKKPNNGMDWEGLGKDAFDMFILSFLGFVAATILLRLFRPELNTAQNALECGMAYAMLALSFRICVIEHARRK